MYKQTLRFMVPGAPIGKERARAGKGKHYTPNKTKAYEAFVASCALAKLQTLPKEMREEWPTKKQVFMDLWIYHKNGRKPDPDNVVKALADGLSGVLWENDKHVLPRVHEDCWPVDEPQVLVRIEFTGYEPGKGKLVRSEL